jgi:hypothetical protein
MNLPNKPVELRRNSQEDLSDNVNHLAMLGINGASPARARGEESVGVLGRKKESHRDALFRRRTCVCL